MVLPQFNSLRKAVLNMGCNISRRSTELHWILDYKHTNSIILSILFFSRTALELAIEAELSDLMTALIRIGADTTDRPYKEIIRALDSPFEYELMDTFEKYEPGLWTAVRQNNASLVHMLLNSWCRVNIRRNNKTLLDYAKQAHKSTDIISTLSDYDITLEFVHATLAGDEKRMLEYLMDAKCDPYIMDISYQQR